MDDQLNNSNQPGVVPDVPQPLEPYQGQAPAQQPMQPTYDQQPMQQPMQQPINQVAPQQAFVQPNQPPEVAQPQPGMPIQEVQPPGQPTQPIQPQQPMQPQMPIQEVQPTQTPLNQVFIQQPEQIQNPMVQDPFATDVIPQSKKSNKALIIILVTLIVLGLAGALAFMMTRSDSQEETTNTPTVDENIDTLELSATTPLGYKITIDEVMRGFEAAAGTGEKEAVVLKVTLTNEGTNTTGAPLSSDMVLISGELEYLPTALVDSELEASGYEKLKDLAIPVGESTTGYIAFVTSKEPTLTFRYKQPEVVTAATATREAVTVKAQNIDIEI